MLGSSREFCSLRLEARGLFRKPNQWVLLGSQRWPLFAFPAEPGLLPFLESPGDANFLLHNTEGFFTSTSWNRGCLRLGRLVATEQAQPAWTKA